MYHHTQLFVLRLHLTRLPRLASNSFFLPQPLDGWNCWPQFLHKAKNEVRPLHLFPSIRVFGASQFHTQQTKGSLIKHCSLFSVLAFERCGLSSPLDPREAPPSGLLFPRRTSFHGLSLVTSGRAPVTLATVPALEQAAQDWSIAPKFDSELLRPLA